MKIDLNLNIENEILSYLDDQTPLSAVLAQAESLTRENFATDRNAAYWRMQLYAPIYVSSYCVNQCLYCGFRAPCAIDRRHLSVDEVVAESRFLLARGFKNHLIVAGESPKVTPAYLAEIMRRLCELGVAPSVEVAPMSVAGYAEIIEAGCRAVTLFQETFDRELYARYHPKGPKADYQWRVEAIERAAEAGMSRLGFGILLGLAEPKRELAAMIGQAMALWEKYPDRVLAFSLPRIHEGPEGFVVPHRVPDELFIRMYCVLRIAFPQAELVLSTRERAELRNRLASACITQMSAESSTEPGGYALAETDAEVKTETSFNGQFLITDARPVEEISQWLLQNGHDVRW